MFPLVPTVTVPLVGCVEITIELGLNAAVPAISFVDRLNVVEPLLGTEKLSAVAVGAFGVEVTVRLTVASFENAPRLSLTL